MTIEEFYDSTQYVGLILTEDLEKNQEDSVVYLFDYNDDWNHPHVECIIINDKLNKIEFLRS